MTSEATRNDTIAHAPTPTLSRRQLVKAGVWAAPVVVLATASPAAASSKGLITVSTPAPTATPASGNSGKYDLAAHFKSTYPASKTVTRTGVTFKTAAGATATGSIKGNATVNIATGSPATAVAIGQVDSVVSGTVVTITYSVPTGTNPTSEALIVVVTIP